MGADDPGIRADRGSRMVGWPPDFLIASSTRRTTTQSAACRKAAALFRFCGAIRPVRQENSVASAGELRVRMWAYPYLTWFAIGGMISILVAMAFIPE
ncbi:hypothetical protein, partial [Burkholderia sp.]|uniref:hypothetical protein n=1 Tax=Burkholderia sp. TaxID=36773 RepID=UPI0025BE9CB8